MNWNRPNADSGDPNNNDLSVDKYEIRYVPEDSLNTLHAPNDYITTSEINNTSSNPSYSLSNLMYGTKYKFQIRARNDAGVWADTTWDQSPYIIASDYTSVPNKPPNSSISNEFGINEIKSSGYWGTTNRYDYSIIQSSSSKYFYSYSNAQWILHDENGSGTNDMKLLRSFDQYSSIDNGEISMIILKILIVIQLYVWNRMMWEENYNL